MYIHIEAQWKRESDGWRRGETIESDAHLAQCQACDHGCVVAGPWHCE
jgi:hypothetical protein